MKIHKVLQGIKSGSEKIASKTETPAAQTTATAASPQEALRSALDATTSSEKSASDKSTVSPIADVTKMAQEIRASEDELAEKRASVLGKAFAIAAVGEFERWQKTAAAMPAQTAVTEEKRAHEAPARRSFESIKAGITKHAGDEYAQGYNETVRAIHATATDEFVKGAAVMSFVLDNQPEAQ